MNVETLSKNGKHFRLDLPPIAQNCKQLQHLASLRVVATLGGHLMNCSAAHGYRVALNGSSVRCYVALAAQ